MTTSRLKIAFILFVPLGGSLLVFKNGMLDDPFITFRYARNLPAGSGAVWNVGGPKVQGYTSTLWMWVSALGIRCGLNPLLFVKLIGALSAVMTLAVILSPQSDAGGRFRAPASVKTESPGPIATAWRLPTGNIIGSVETEIPC